MMKSIINMIKMDFKLIIRDKIALFTAMAPAILSFAFLSVIGSASSGSSTFAVVKNVPVETVQRLESFGSIEYFNDIEGMRERVLRSDSAAGISYENNELKITLEGNEPEGFDRKMQVLLSKAQSGNLPHFEVKQVESNNNLIIKITSISLLLLAIFVSGAVSGFNIVSERESRSIRAIAISPLGLKKYIFSRSIVALMLAVINIALSITIMGKTESIIQMIVVTLFCLPLLGLISFVFGSTASNQITAIGSLKLIMPVCLIIPIASLFVPQNLKFLFYWLPNYWQYEALASVWEGSINWLMCGTTFGVSLLWFMLLYKIFSRKLQLK